MYSLPPGATGIPVLDHWVGGSGEESISRRGDIDVTGPSRAGGRRRRTSFSLEGQHKSPLETYLPYLNFGLCAVLVTTDVIRSTRLEHEGHFGWIGLGNLPAVVYVVVLLSKMVMGGVDPERELSAMRYEYKGA